MTPQPDTIRQSELLNQRVIDRTTMEEIGRVEVLWTYPPAHKVLGFVCKSGLLGAKKYAFNLGQIHTLGASILVNSGAQETDGDKVSQLESLIGCEVWSEAGERIGWVNDCMFSLKTGQISDYLVFPGALAVVTEGVLRLPPSKILSTGRRRILITEGTARSLEAYRPGIKGRLGKVTESLKQEYTGATQGLRSLTQRARSATEQAKERARTLAEQMAEQAREQAERLREESQLLAQQARERGQGLVEQVKENTQSWTEQVQEQFDFVVEELGSPEVPRGEESEEVAPLDEEDLLSGDWGLPLPIPTPTPEPPIAESEAATPIAPPAPVNLEDDFWEEPISPNLPSTIDPASVPAGPETEAIVPESATLPKEPTDAATPDNPAIAPPEEDDEPWI